MLPLDILKPVLIAGTLLAVMSVVDTLAYGVRTAGVLTKRLAISLALFNILVVFSRLSNMFSAPVLGNLPDKVEQGIYLESDVLVGLRIALLFVIGGVFLGALLTPGFIRFFSRGIEIMEIKGSLPPTVLHGLTRLHHFPRHFTLPKVRHIVDNIDFRGLPLGFLVFNVLVTCFYSIGVLSTVLAASWNHDVSGTAILLSGIVNGIATLLLFLIVDPPAAVVIDGCISGARPPGHARAMNLYLVVTRLAGTVLALALLPPMGRYVLYAAEGVDAYFSKGQPALVAESRMLRGDLHYDLKVLRSTADEYSFDLSLKNTSSEAIEIARAGRDIVQFTVSVDGADLWTGFGELSAGIGTDGITIAPHKLSHFTATWHDATLSSAPFEDLEIVVTAALTAQQDEVAISARLYPPRGDIP